MTTEPVRRPAAHQHGIITRAKDADLLEAGHRVVRVTWDRLTRDGKREAARFRKLLGES